jgi:hypothetical protein
MSAKDWAEDYLKLKVVPKKKRNYLEKIAGKNIYVLSSSGVAICGSCNKRINIKVKHKTQCECPKCKKKMTVQHVWRMSQKMEEFDFLVVPEICSDDVVVFRYILSQRFPKRADYAGENLDAIKGSPWNTREVARMYYNKNYQDPVFYEYVYSWEKGKKEWQKGKYHYFRPDTYSYLCSNSHWCMYAYNDYENAMEVFSKLSCFKYYPLEDIWDPNGSIYQIHYLMRTSAINEKLHKMGLDNIVKANYIAWYNSDCYEVYKRKTWLYGDRPVLKTLRLTKPQFEIFKQRPSVEMQRFLQHHPDVTIDEMKAVEFDLYKLRNLYAVSKSVNVTRNKMFKYIHENKINISEYSHYLNLLGYLHYDLKDTYYSMPKNFRKADKKITSEYNAEQKRQARERERLWKKQQKIGMLPEDKKNKLIAKISAGLRKMPDLKEFLNGSDGLLVHIPESAEELRKEGRALHNCIGTYVTSIASNNTLVFYVRRIDKPDEAFVAFEYKDGKVVQCRYDHNKSVDDPKIINFVDRFAEMLRRNKVLVAA